MMDINEALVGLRCWHASVGGASAPSFLLAFGDKLRRPRPLQNPAQPEEYRLHRGASELLVWCSWRLQSSKEVFASSDQDEAGVIKLRELVGEDVVHVTCNGPAWDLSVRFSGGFELAIFCDHVGPDSSIAQNWELLLVGRAVRAGPGTEWEEETLGG